MVTLISLLYSESVTPSVTLACIEVNKNILRFWKRRSRKVTKRRSERIFRPFKAPFPSYSSLKVRNFQRAITRKRGLKRPKNAFGPSLHNFSRSSTPETQNNFFGGVASSQGTPTRGTTATVPPYLGSGERLVIFIVTAFSRTFREEQLSF